MSWRSYYYCQHPELVKYRFQFDGGYYYTGLESRARRLSWIDEDIGRLAYCKGSEPLFASGGQDLFEQWRWLTDKVSASTAAALNARERLVRHKESKYLWGTHGNHGPNNCIQNIKYWRRRLIEHCNKFGMVYAVIPTKDEWKRIALRYKAMYHLETVLRPMARRLTQGKD